MDYEVPEEEAQVAADESIAANSARPFLMRKSPVNRHKLSGQPIAPVKLFSGGASVGSQPAAQWLVLK
jgi:hypothetical protein